MAKTCGDCEKRSYETGFENDRVFERFRCSITGFVHERDHQCDVLAKPRLCDVLGVVVGQRFTVNTGIEDELPVFYIDDAGSLCQAENGDRNIGVFWLLLAINHPERIERLPLLTPEEVRWCREFGAKWLSRDGNTDMVELWEVKPKPDNRGVYIGQTAYIARIRCELFPTVRPGQLIRVEDEPSEGAVEQ